MGLYSVICPVCKGVWIWHSNNPDQRCGDCRMKLDPYFIADTQQRRIEELEAKLEKAVEALREIANKRDMSLFNDWAVWRALKTILEIEK